MNKMKNSEGLTFQERQGVLVDGHFIEVFAEASGIAVETGRVVTFKSLENGDFLVAASSSQGSLTPLKRG